MNNTAVCLVAVAAASGIAMGDTVSSTDTKVAELTELVGELQHEIAELRASSGDDWLTEQRAEEIRGLVTDVLADADTRASLLQSGMTAGYDGGFVVGSTDGNFLLKLNGQLQVRYVWNQQDGVRGSNNDENRAGFENRRTKLKLKGHVVDPSWGYAVTGAFGRNGGDLNLEDAFISKKLGNGWTVRAGQFKSPFMREELVSSSRQTLVDRSLVNETFNQGFSQGVEIGWKGDQLQWKFMYGDGFRSANRDFRNGLLPFDNEYAFTGRVEWLAAGNWKQFKDFAGWRGGDFGMLIGGAVHYERQEYGTPDRDEIGDFRVTADISLEWDGANLFASFVYRDIDNDAPGAVLDGNPYGFTVQGGYFLSDDWEVFARYEYGDQDAPSALDVDDLSVVTVGVNRYWAKHGLKWTTDFGYAFDQVDLFWASSGVGWRVDVPNQDGQMVLRSQLQLTF